MDTGAWDGNRMDEQLVASRDGGASAALPVARLLTPSEVEQGHGLATSLLNGLGQAIFGQKELLELVVICLLARGNMLLEGLPGLGKTELIKSLSQLLGLQFRRIQFTPDLLPGDIVGAPILQEEAGQRRLVFHPGPIFANLVLADEINRASPKTQSALLEAMNEGQVTVDAHSYPLPQPFLVIATQNPVEHHGTYPLPESQLDRFLMRVRMGYPDSDAEREILRSEAGAAKLEGMRPVLSGADLLEMQQALAKIRVDDSLVSYALAIVGKTRESEHLSLGVSPRGSQMLYRAAQAMAFLDGRAFCTPEDFKPLVVPVFAHRVVVNGLYASTLKKSEQAEQVLQEIVESTPVPM